MIKQRSFTYPPLVIEKGQYLNKKKTGEWNYYYVDGIISLKAAYVEAIILAITGLILGFYVSPMIGFGILTLLILSGWLYNYPPAIWKNKPILGMAVNVAGGWIIYCLGWQVFNSQSIIPVQSIGYVFACAAVFLNTTRYNGHRRAR